MDIATYVKSLPDRSARASFASRIGTSLGYLNNLIAEPHRRAGAALVAEAERASGGVVTRIECRPDDWHRIWPELAERHPDLVPRTTQQAG